MDESKSPKDLAKAEKLRNTVLRVGHEAFQSVASFVAEAASTIAAVGPLNKRVSKATVAAQVQMQIVLGRLADFLQSERKADGSFKASMPRAAVIACFNDLYNGMLHAAKDVGQAAFDEATKQYIAASAAWNAMTALEQESVPAPTPVSGTKTDWGKTAHRPWTGKRRTIQNVMRSLLSPDHQREVRAVLNAALAGKPGKWNELAKAAFQVQRKGISDSNTRVLYGHPVGDPSALWYLRQPRSEYVMRDDEDGNQVTDIVWGQKPHGYTATVVVLGDMELSELYARMEKTYKNISRTKSKLESDMTALADREVPEVFVLVPSSTDPYA